MHLIQKAIDQNQRLLSEHDSKEFLKSYGIPVAKEVAVYDQQGVLEGIRTIGFPLVMKACQPGLNHKTEKNLVFVDIRSEQEAITAFESLMGEDPAKDRSVLVAERVAGERELMAGLMTDPQFGFCLMFGLGGIFTELFRDTVFRVVPITSQDAFDMLDEISGRAILDKFRGMPVADKEEIKDILLKLNSIALENEIIQEIDMNPIILSDKGPKVVDALVVLKGLSF